jgi:ankyrin repeat protein
MTELLIEACKEGNINKAEELLDGGADPNIVNYIHGETPLHWAIYYGHIEISKLLLKAGADTKRANIYGETSLHRAVAKNHTHVAKLLLKAEAKPNKANVQMATPLRWAAGLGYMELTELLLKAGADPNQANRNGYTPIYWAVRNGHTKIVELLNNKPAVLSLRLLCLNYININQVPAPNPFPELLLNYDNYEL